jgi:uncharacterized protein
MKKLVVKKSSIEGNGIFTLEPIFKHEHIAFIKGVKKVFLSTDKESASSIPTWYGLTEKEWIDPTGTVWEYLNHSCKPNAAIVGTRKLIALRDIKKNEEIVIDYSMTDGDLNWQMDCFCKDKKCRKTIGSIQEIPQSVFHKHMPFIPKYFIKLRKDFEKMILSNNETQR